MQEQHNINRSSLVQARQPEMVEGVGATVSSSEEEGGGSDGVLLWGSSEGDESTR